MLSIPILPAYCLPTRKVHLNALHVKTVHVKERLSYTAILVV